MFMILPVILSLVIALLLRRPLARLADVQLRYPSLVLIAILLQVILFSEPFSSTLTQTGYVPIINTFTYVLSIGFCVLNLRVKSLIIVAMGTLLNGLAIVVNGGYMPADFSAMEITNPATAKKLADAAVVNNSAPITDTTRLPFLTDVFNMPPWMPLANVFSLGDIIIAVGAFCLIQELLVLRPSEEKRF